MEPHELFPSGKSVISLFELSAVDIQIDFMHELFGDEASTLQTTVALFDRRPERLTNTIHKVDNNAIRLIKRKRKMAAKKRGKEIRQFIIENVTARPNSIVTYTADQFGISRQAAHKHIQKLIESDALVASGNTKNREYHLSTEDKIFQLYKLDKGHPDENQIWRDFVRPNLGELNSNVLDFWNYGVTEIINNVIDHSNADAMNLELIHGTGKATLRIYDDGDGIFQKLMAAFGFEDPQHAALELAKGKLTTDPDNHTGEGIFFTSRLFDEFVILSRGTYFSHSPLDEISWFAQNPDPVLGTMVTMELSNSSTRTTNEIFDEYAGPDEYAFTRTVIPVRMAVYEDQGLISRSQAKRLLARTERFESVVVDFDGVESIGQAFADEIFRVFKNKNPNIELKEHNACREVMKMITRARAHK